MKRIFLAIPLILACFAASAQEIWCQDNAVMFSTCFDLHEDGTFDYEGFRCSFTGIGWGEWRKEKRKLILEFVPADTVIVLPLDSAYSADSVDLKVVDYYTGEPLEFLSVRGKNWGFLSNEEGWVRVPVGEQIITHYAEGEFAFTLNPGKGQKRLFRHPGHERWRILINNGQKIVMKKRGNRYFWKYKTTVFGEEKEKKVWVTEWYGKRGNEE